MFAAFALIVPYASTPAHPLPGYMLFLACLVPWALWLAALLRRRGGAESASAVVAIATVLAFTYPAEIVATYGRYWQYFEDRDVLVGVRLGGVPIEEFFFYPLMLALALWLYLQACEQIRARRLANLSFPRGRLPHMLLAMSILCFLLCLWALARPEGLVNLPASRSWDDTAVPHFSEGRRDYAWTATCLAGLGGSLGVLYLAELTTLLQLRAVLPATLVFFTMGMLIDLLGVSHGWWVYNTQRVSPFWLGPIPVENLAMYLCGVPETVAIFEFARRLFGERRTA